MAKLTSIFISFLFVFSVFAQKAVVISDCTVLYSITGSDAGTNSNLSGASKQYYIKGKMARTDIAGQGYKQTVIVDNSNGTAVILKEIGAEKYKSTLNAEEWKQENKRFENMTLSPGKESKTILGYTCQKATATLKDGGTYTIYYAPAVIPSANDNAFQFKDVPGLILEYETVSSNGISKITYTAYQVDFNPVPALKFQIPTAGYRIWKQQ
jgi:GLPGLI family protein